MHDGTLNTVVDFQNALAPGLYMVNLIATDVSGQAAERRFTERLVIPVEVRKGGSVPRFKPGFLHFACHIPRSRISRVLGGPPASGGTMMLSGP